MGWQRDLAVTWRRCRSNARLKPDAFYGVGVAGALPSLLSDSWTRRPYPGRTMTEFLTRFRSALGGMAPAQTGDAVPEG